ncbi:hypothetical protein [Amycolatopsis sp. NPDC059021]|uniref:hypothetical protein n=1 Tax=Amycolatopsis sp. NPDC059021 TaxID=3346704 RepID=UPI0036722FF7
MVELFTAATLTALSGRPVSAETAAAIHAWVVAEISAEIGPVPDGPPAGVLAVALELGKAAVPPPGGVASATVGPYSATYAAHGSSGGGLDRAQRIRLWRAVGKGKPFSITTVVPPVRKPR